MVSCVRSGGPSGKGTSEEGRFVSLGLGHLHPDTVP